MADTLRTDEADAAVAFIAARQGDPTANIAYLGTEAEGIAAELGGLSPPWATTARVVRSPGGALAGVVVVEWDEELGRAWAQGPWVDAPPGEDGVAAWLAVAGELLDAALAQLPAGVTRHEMSGDVANTRLAALATERGWSPTEANHILVADATVLAGWGRDRGADARIRPAAAGDDTAIAPLHDAEFPGTYASAAQLVAGALDGSRTVLVAEAAAPAAPAGAAGPAEAAEAEGEGSRRLAGYAAGQVHDDGEGFVDFVVVDERARGTGVGRSLVTALTRRLLATSPQSRVALTVQDHRTPARALYDSLGFRPEGTLVAYRTGWP